VALGASIGHILLWLKLLSPEEFSPPESSFDDEGAHFRFWIFDTDHMEPAYFDVTVAPDRTTRHEERRRCD
jgi:hypothetical protein